MGAALAGSVCSSWSASVAATPAALMACLAVHHRAVLVVDGGRGCRWGLGELEWDDGGEAEGLLVCFTEHHCGEGVFKRDFFLFDGVFHA